VTKIWILVGLGFLVIGIVLQAKRSGDEPEQAEEFVEEKLAQPAIAPTRVERVRQLQQERRKVEAELEKVQERDDKAMLQIQQKIDVMKRINPNYEAYGFTEEELREAQERERQREQNAQNP